MLSQIECGAVRRLVQTSEGAKEVLELMEGESPYSDDRQADELDRDSGRAWSLALHYVRFVSEFGPVEGRVVRDGKVHQGFPEDFEAWLRMGAPGMSSGELDRYLRDHPLME